MEKPSQNPDNKSVAPKPSKSPSHPLGSDGSHWAMTYSPYSANGDCKDGPSVAQDIASIASKGFSSIRLYSSDCSGLEHAGSVAKSKGLKLILGIYISERGITDAKAQIHDIIAWADEDWAAVEMIVIGNEAIFNEYCSAAELATFITTTKSTFQQAGYHGPITTAEPINILTDHADLLCPVIDVVAANIHPFFNPTICADQAGDFVAPGAACPGGHLPGHEELQPRNGLAQRRVPERGRRPGPGRTSSGDREHPESRGGKSVFFSFVDDGWKDAGQFGV